MYRVDILDPLSLAPSLPLLPTDRDRETIDFKHEINGQLQIYRKEMEENVVHLIRNNRSIVFHTFNPARDCANSFFLLYDIFIFII